LQFLQELGIQFVEESVQLRNAICERVLSDSDEKRMVQLQRIGDILNGLKTNITSEDVIAAADDIVCGAEFSTLRNDIMSSLSSSI
jgi:hypothetical protein